LCTAASADTLAKGAVNSEVTPQLPDGSLAHAVISSEARLELAIKPGAPASVLYR
jgi:molybdate transport system regulatory protein